MDTIPEYAASARMVLLIVLMLVIIFMIGTFYVLQESIRGEGVHHGHKKGGRLRLCSCRHCTPRNNAGEFSRSPRRSKEYSSLVRQQLGTSELLASPGIRRNPPQGVHDAGGQRPAGRHHATSTPVVQGLYGSAPLVAWDERSQPFQNS